MQRTDNPTFAGLLRSAVDEPGTLSTASEQFHNYSLGNQLLAMFQCHQRGLKAGPMATYPRWNELGRHVRKGEKALTLCMPITVKRRDADTDSADSSAVSFVRFVYRSRWFVQSQTRGSGAAGAEHPRVGRCEGTRHSRYRRSRVWFHRWQRDGLRQRTGDSPQSPQPTAAQDAVPRASACVARPYGRRSAE